MCCVWADGGCMVAVLLYCGGASCLPGLCNSSRVWGCGWLVHGLCTLQRVREGCVQQPKVL